MQHIKLPAPSLKRHLRRQCCQQWKKAKMLEIAALKSKQYMYNLRGRPEVGKGSIQNSIPKTQTGCVWSKNNLQNNRTSQIIPSTKINVKSRPHKVGDAGSLMIKSSIFENLWVNWANKGHIYECHPLCAGLTFLL